MNDEGTLLYLIALYIILVPVAMKVCFIERIIYGIKYSK